MDWTILAAIAFVSSTVTATIGIGGGILLISLMPGIVPPGAIVPIHGVAQTASNVSRAALVAGRIDLPAVSAYAFGAVLGTIIGAPFVSSFPIDRLPLVLGLFVLVAVWGPYVWSHLRAMSDGSGPESDSTIRRGRNPLYALLGAIQAPISLFVGATGPLAAPLLLRSGFSRERLVATHAGLMTILHGFKVVAFAVLGFEFGAWWRPLIAVIVAVLLGSWVGTRLRSHVPEARFRRWFRWGVTLLALRMILGVAI